MVFSGIYENSIDDKNRMTIPSKYRNQLNGACMLARGFDRCLYIYAMEDWNVLVEKMRKLRQTDRDMRKFIREFFSNATECQLDSQGRILIPQHLKNYAGIRKELLTMGALDKIEVWSREVYNDPEEDLLDNEDFLAKIEAYDL
ncbi:MAG: division/cell wall cluster transcriptional repressor MraZ [Mogibacterium sp.]|nr:division/cell wall cluster transcriptional repressor MraZ [Mogibacterium sp.]